MDNPKILIGSPTSYRKHYCFLNWLMRVRALTYENADLYMVDNSPDTNYQKYLQHFGVDCGHVDPAGKNSQEYICESQNLIRQKVLDEGYDYFFSLESDIFPPLNIIEKLLDNLINYDLPIVGCAYHIDHGANSYLLVQKFEYGIHPEIDLIGTNMHRNLSFGMMNGRLQQSDGNGIGCSMISRELLEAVEFRVEEGKIHHSDSFLYEDLFKMNIPNYLDTSVVLEHDNSDWNIVSDLKIKQKN